MILETPAILGLLPDKTGDLKGERKTMMESQHRKVVRDGSCGRCLPLVLNTW